MTWSKEKMSAWRIRNKDRLRQYAKDNYNPVKKKAWRKKNKARIKVASSIYWQKNKHRWAETHRDNYLKRVYGIDIVEYNELFRKQNGCCAICGVHQTKQKRIMAVDHDHESRRVRGLLCFMCNTALGKFNDDCEVLNKAIQYLNAHR